ncbi:7861_t:CDS:2, partial [Racocetra persica]
SRSQQKNKNHEIKNSDSQQNRDTNCMAILTFKLEKSNIGNSHPLEINLHYMHNHLPSHMIAIAKHIYEDKLHLSATNNDEFIHLLADQIKNPDSNFLQHLYNQFCLAQLGDRNGKGIFEQLQEMVIKYNNTNNSE